MPCCREYAISSAGVLLMRTRIWFTIGATVQGPTTLSMSAASKLDRPIARTFFAS
jgi:hypothetical protein